MVFPRNAGFGRCYLVSTRHEILSNIDRNLTGTRLRLRKNRNKINPARVRIPSQLYCCRLCVSNSKKFYFHNQTPQHSTWQRLVVGDSPRGQLRRHGSTPVSTLLPKLVGFFIINIFLVVKMLSELKSGKCWTRLASHPLQYGNWSWWNNPPICKVSSEENGTGQYPEPQERGL